MSETLRKKLHDALVEKYFGFYKQLVLAALKTGSVSIPEYDPAMKELCSGLTNADVLKFSKKEEVGKKEYLVYKLTDEGKAIALEMKA